MRNVLVIDDEAAISSILRQALSRSGFNVDTAGTGEEGIVKFDSEVFDLVITDICMVGVDGIDVARHIRNSLRGTTPIIGISGTPWLLEEAEFDAVLAKPFSLKALTDIVASLTGAVVPKNWTM